MPASPSTRERGREAEQRAARFLEARGFSLVCANFEAAGAEVDLILRGDDDGTPLYVFVEVRSRAREDLGHAVETVGPTKQVRVRRGATAYLVQAGLWDQVAVRFDVIGVDPGVPGDEGITWIPGAFEA